MKRYVPIAVILASIAVVYRGWLLTSVISGGDWGYYTSAHLRDYWPIPPLWDGSIATGSAVIFSGLSFPILGLSSFVNHLGVGYALNERLIWVFPSVVVGALSTYALALAFFSSRVAGVIGALVAVFNSYIANVVTGGQFTVGMSYALMPLALLLFYRALCKPAVARLALTALCLAVQVMYDARTTYMTLGVLSLFVLHYLLAQPTARAARRVIVRVTAQFLVVGVIAILVHAFWLLPAHYAEKIASPLPAGYTSTFWVHVLSYMQLSHGFTLFHPFGYQPVPRIVPLDPVVFLLPLPVFAVFLRRTVTYVELFLFSLAMLSIFLLKGSNAPANGAYDWLFLHIPGFAMYRDPSKFYQPLALAYALLLGRAATWTCNLLERSPLPWHSLRVAGRILAPITCLALLLPQVSPVAANTNWGTLAPQSIPDEYRALQQYIDKQHGFFRVMWVRHYEMFGPYSAIHPVIDADTIGAFYLSKQLPDPNNFSSWLLLPKATSVLKALSIKYVVVGDEPNNTSSSYRQQRADTVKMVRQALPGSAQIRIGRIYLFQTPSYLPVVYIPSGASRHLQGQGILWRAAPSSQQAAGRSGAIGEFSSACGSCIVTVSQNHTRYEVSVRSAHPFLLVLNQSFDPNWAAYVEPSVAAQPFWWTWTHPAVAHRYHLTVNGFANAWWITAPGAHRIVLEYWPQRLTDIGWIVCWLTILGCIAMAVVPAIIPRLRQCARLVRRSVPRSVADRPLVGTAGQRRQ